ncbi:MULTISPECIES: HlyD family efflux transporter periplasmic adaptor subunit [Paenibacillus]|uniref:HlyD family efflux transporter periplasmic adaptor subunit n=1 Tax=Paenibacillus violae TaxID=3077234 RepID=A0ABU3RF51_9BACL|nr:MULTISPECIES: HlyD family efflux transporter periplasmic adaptor subunit [Paenibacillus]MDU0202467.1 HlyD family efflux transporter periplasmic adaptor subunit [Paenibacillus sp. PFR10]MEC0268305.1 HlyD family efflux transporter periplasmic adaptor subunit [Paenibacillus anseongense]
MKRKLILIIILAVIVLSGAFIGSYYWYQGANYVATDNARISGDIYRVMPRISGKINTLGIKMGDTVVADQIVGQQDITNLSNSLLDQASLRAPISGTVIQTSAKVGEVVAPGQSVAMIVDKNALYVSADIDETKIKKVHVGQVVTFDVDTYGKTEFQGKIMEIGQATASTFSLLPTTSSSGNFTKVTQRMSVKISIDDNKGLDLAPGMNASIKIHIKGE